MTVCFEEVKDLAVQLLAWASPALDATQNFDAVSGASEVELLDAVDAEVFDLVVYLIKEGQFEAIACFLSGTHQG